MLPEHLDELGFDEAWIGEHHSGGYEMIDAPEVVIPQEFAAAGKFSPTCPPDVQKMYTAIWTEPTQ